MNHHCCSITAVCADLRLLCSAVLAPCGPALQPSSPAPPAASASWPEQQQLWPETGSGSCQFTSMMPSKLTAYPDPTLLPHLWAWLSRRLQHRWLVWRAGGCCTVSGQTVLGWFQGEHENMMRMRLKCNTENRRKILLFGMGCTGPLVLCWSWSPGWLRGPERADDLNIFHVLVQNRPQRYFRATLDCSCVILEDVLVHFCVSISIKQQQKQTFLSLYWTQIHHLTPPTTSDHCFSLLQTPWLSWTLSPAGLRREFWPNVKVSLKPSDLGRSFLEGLEDFPECAEDQSWKCVQPSSYENTFEGDRPELPEESNVTTMTTKSPLWWSHWSHTHRSNTHTHYTHVLRPSELMVLLSSPFNLMSK